MKNRFELSSVDMATFLIMSILGVRILTLPRVLATEMDTGSWVTVLAAGFLTAILSLMMYWFGIKYPGKNGSEIVLLTFGKYLGTAGIFAIGVHILGYCSFARKTRNFCTQFENSLYRIIYDIIFKNNL